jgi:two-component system CheB/CheR fusion protein
LLTKPIIKKKITHPSSFNLNENSFPVVGIGASAGGLKAIEKLLEHLPLNTQLALVIIQHLSSNQNSMLPEILSRSTKMNVLKVHNDMKIAPNQVYVIPPGQIMTIKDNSLKLKPKDTLNKPIDEFLFSLAQERKTQAIGIILSGTGSDGTKGLQAIRTEGGITFAQDPKSTLYSDMPNSAISAEAVDRVLPPEGIAQELIKIAQHPEIWRRQLCGEINPPIDENENATRTILTLLKASFGVNFTYYKRATINRRITRRIILKQIEDIKKYAEFLRTHNDELEALFEDLLINVTGFFREPKTFMLLKEKVFPKFFEKKELNQPIRVWVPGCSTGEEVYSTAIAIEEFLEENHIADAQIQIFGTDVNIKNVERARKGLYLKNIEEHISENQLKRFFVATNGNYQISKQIRDMCIFAKHDLIKDPPFFKLDLVICRNVLIYFDHKLHERILPLFHYALNLRGYLVLGESEAVGNFTYLYEALTEKGLIYQKKLTRQNYNPALEPSTSYSSMKLVEKSANVDSRYLIEKEVDALLMAEYVPASLVLNSNLDVLSFRGKVEPYLSIDAGTAILNAANIVRKELRNALQIGIYKAQKNMEEIKETVHLKQGNNTVTVNIQIRPLRLPQREDKIFIALFEETPETASTRIKILKISGQFHEGILKDQQIKELGEVAESTKQTLRSVIEEKDAVNEELLSSMEEFQSSNEELMSTNEELETAKEELQSTNEELSTVNDELNNRNLHLLVLNDDLANLMINIDSAVIIVDNNFMIRRFNNSAETLLRLKQSDVGSLITSFRLGLPIESFEKILAKAMKLEAVREEIPSDDGRWYQMRVRPYLTQEKKASGLVISFADITEMKLLDKLSVVSSFTRHDIRNKLAVLNGHIYLAQKQVKNQSELEKQLNKIPDVITQIEKIFEVSKSYELLGRQKIEFIDVGKTVDAAAVTYFSNPAGIKIINQVRGLKVLADSILSVIFGNLMDNTVKYGGDKTTKIRVYAEKQLDGSLEIVYEDDGVGIDLVDRLKLFEKSYGKGTGYGLFLIKNACDIYGWKITEEGEPGKGVKFIFVIPKLEKSGQENYKIDM